MGIRDATELEMLIAGAAAGLFVGGVRNYDLFLQSVKATLTLDIVTEVKTDLILLTKSLDEGLIGAGIGLLVYAGVAGYDRAKERYSQKKCL